MQKQLVALIILSSLSFQTGCSTWRKLDDTEKGAVIGGGTGVVVGNAIAPGAAGTVLGGAAGAVGGGLIGREVEKDKRRRRY